MINMLNMLVGSFVHQQLHAWKSFRLFWDEMKHVFAAKMTNAAFLLA